MNITRKSVSYKDNRGKIIDILTDAEIDSLTLITSKQGAIRGDHYHKNTVQYTFIIMGELILLTQNDDEKMKKTPLQPNDFVTILPYERHAIVSLTDSIMLAVTNGPRKGIEYESDTYRLSDNESLISKGGYR